MNTELAGTTIGAGTPVDASTIDRESFDRTAPYRAAMKVADAPHYTLDAFYAAGKALWTLPRVMAHRPDLMTLPKYDIGHLDRFGDYARALRFVQTEILRRIQRSTQLPEVAAAGWQMRSMMMSYAETLSYKGHFAPELLARLREGSGYRDLVEDLSVLVRELQGLPESKIGPDAPVTPDDLKKAAELAHVINVQVGTGPEADLSQEELLGERQKLGGLLVTAHSQIRRGVSYFRWAEGDVNTLVPSLYVPPGHRKSTDPTTEAPPDLAALHAQLHAAQTAAAPAAPVAPEDHPFTSE